MTTQPAPVAPILTGRDIGVAYFATAALREQLLADIGITFADSLLLTALARTDGSAARARLVDELVSGLKITAGTAASDVDELIAHGLATEEATAVTATPTGFEAHRRFNDRVAQSQPKIYGGIPADDLAAAKRVLDIVTERANRELALGTTA
jgi:hypothetical protein